MSGSLMRSDCGCGEGCEFTPVVLEGHYGNPCVSGHRIDWVPKCGTVAPGVTQPASMFYMNDGVSTSVAPAGWALGPCPQQDVEVTERLVCAAGVTLVRQERWLNGTSTAVAFFGINGVSVAAPAAFTEGPCDDQDIDIESEYVCAAGTTLIRRRLNDAETGALISETFVGTNGAVVPTPPAYTEGPCVQADVEVVHDIACVSGVTVLREQVVTNGVVSGTTWFGANGAVIAAPAVFTWGPCPSSPDNEFVVLCDTNTTPPTPYIRRAIVDAVTGAVTWSNVDLTGAAYTATTPGVCDGYSVVTTEVCVVDTVSFAVVPARSTQVFRYSVAIGSPLVTNRVTGAAITLSGTVLAVDCSSYSSHQEVLCDANGNAFIRRYFMIGANQIGFLNLGLDGLAGGAPVAPVGPCGDVTVDIEYVCFTIAGANVPGRVERAWRDGVLLSEVYTRTDTYVTVAAGTPIVPCATSPAQYIPVPGGIRVLGAATPTVFTIPAGRNSFSVYARCAPAATCPPPATYPTAPTLTGGQFTAPFYVLQGETFTFADDEEVHNNLGGPITLTVPLNSEVVVTWVS